MERRLRRFEIDLPELPVFEAIATVNRDFHSSHNGTHGCDQTVTPTGSVSTPATSEKRRSSSAILARVGTDDLLLVSTLVVPS